MGQIKRLGIAAAIGLGVGVWLVLTGPCQRHALLKPEQVNVTLKENEKAKVIVDTRRREIRYAVRLSSNVVSNTVIKEARRATLVVKETGEVEVQVRRWGFTIEPGLSLAYDRKPKIAGDLRFFYIGQLGAEVGTYYRDYLRVYLAGSVELSRFRLFNTSLWAGINLQKEPIFGVRLSL